MSSGASCAVCCTQRRANTRGRGTRFTLSRDELLTLPEFVLLSLFPNGLLPDGSASAFNAFHEGDVYPVDVRSISYSNPPTTDADDGASAIVVAQAQASTLKKASRAQSRKALSSRDSFFSDRVFSSEQYDPISLQYMLEFFRNVAQSMPSRSPSPDAADGVSSIDPVPGSAQQMLQDRAGIIVLREDLDYYVIPPKRDISQPEMMEVKRAAGRALLAQNGIFSGLRKSEEAGSTEQHLIEMLTAGYVSPLQTPARDTRRLMQVVQRLQPRRRVGPPRR